jgi:hypothetical protein
MSPASVITENADRQPPPHLLAAAESDYQAMRKRLEIAVRGTRLVAVCRDSEVEAFAEAYYTLSRTDPGLAAAIGAAALVQLAMDTNATTPAESPGTTAHRRS